MKKPPRGNIKAFPPGMGNTPRSPLPPHRNQKACLQAEEGRATLIPRFRLVTLRGSRRFGCGTPAMARENILLLPDAGKGGSNQAR